MNMNKRIFLENIVIFILLPIILFLVFLKPILPKNTFETKLQKTISPLQTARIDIKNFGNENNAVKILKIKNKKNTVVSTPNWFKNEQGQGTKIETVGKNVIFKIKCINDGELSIQLTGLNKSNKDGKRYPIWIDYTLCEINGKNILKDDVTKVWHDKRFTYKIDVKNNDEVILKLKWNIHDYSEEELNDYIDVIFLDSISVKDKSKLAKKLGKRKKEANKNNF